MSKYSYRQLEAMAALPDSLRKSLQALIDLGGQATALQVAQKTNRTRPVECVRLNQLALMKLVEKHKDGKKIVYRLTEDLR